VYSIDIEKDLQPLRTPEEISLIAQCHHPRRESLFDILHLLGSSSHIKQLDSNIELYELLNAGFRNRVLRSLIKKTGVGLGELSIALGISQTTLKKRLGRTGSNGRFSANQSAALWQFATVFVLAQHVLGSSDNANYWLCSEARALRYRKPIEFLALAPGAELVIHILQQLHFGVYL
jgi:putative toxin-antitoxin system antitoxin component (TIGR02293 family)